MIDALRTYHTMLRSSGSSGYPNMSFFNPQHQQQPFPLAGQVEPLYNPYQRLPARTYSQTTQQSIGIGPKYMLQKPRTYSTSTNLLQYQGMSGAAGFNSRPGYR